VTLLAYRYAVNDFAAFLGPKAGQPIHYVIPAQVAAWRDARAKKATPRTANNKLKIIRILFQSAWRDGLITDNPAAKVASLRVGESTRRAFTLPELKSILRVASPEWRGIILAGLYTGQRLKDMRAESVRVVGTNTLRRARRKGAFLDQAREAKYPEAAIADLREALRAYSEAFGLVQPVGSLAHSVQNYHLLPEVK